MKTNLTLEKGEDLRCNNCGRPVDLLIAWFVLAPTQLGFAGETTYWAYCTVECLEQLTIEFAIEDAEKEAQAK